MHELSEQQNIHTPPRIALATKTTLFVLGQCTNCGVRAQQHPESSSTSPLSTLGPQFGGPKTSVAESYDVVLKQVELLMGLLTCHMTRDRT